MHAPVLLYRLRDRLALTRPELMTLLCASALFGLGLIVQEWSGDRPRVDLKGMEPQAALSAGTSEEVSLSTETADAPTTVPSIPVEVQEIVPIRTGPPVEHLSGPVALNTATAAQLETLPRVGPKLAQRILDYRSAHGSFSSVEELRRVKGIGQKTLDQLRPLVTLD